MKRIVLNCVGGPLDGRYVTDLTIPERERTFEQSFAYTAYVLSNRGTVGKRINLIPPSIIETISDGIANPRDLRIVPPTYALESGYRACE